MRRAALMVFVAALALAAPAQAAFPGKNGKIAFVRTQGPGDTDIYTINPDGSGLANLTNNPADDGEPAWSPDGKKIAFVSQRDGPPAFNCVFVTCGVIYVMSVDGTNVTRLTSPSDTAESPAWSPDGSKIAFFLVHAGQGDMWLMNSDGSNPVELNVPDAKHHRITWSPDGQEIVYDWEQDVCDAACSHEYGISSVRPDGTGHRLLHSNGIDPNWSPDSTRVVFADFPNLGGNGGQITTMDRNGNNLIVFDTGFDSWPTWSPDGSKFVFTREDDGSLYVMSNGSTVTQLATGAMQPDWQPLPVGTGYARPKGATPFQTYFTVAYKPCTSPNEQHGAPLAVLSCSPPQQASNYLTVGTLDANGQPAKSVGSMRLDVKQGNPSTSQNEADVKVNFSEKDIRNKSDLTPYAGELDAQMTWQETDKWSGPIGGGQNGSQPATSQELIIPLSGSGVQCTPNPADLSAGSICQSTTTLNSIIPGMVQEEKRMNIEIPKVQVFDGGADLEANTRDDNTLFLTEGVFVP